MTAAKAYRKNLILSLGLISVSVDLTTVAPRKASGLNRLCPDHTVKLSQKYKCPGTAESDEHEVAWGSWNMGYETADGYTVVNVEDKPSIEASGGLSLVPVPAKDLESATFEGEAIYYAEPSNEHVEQTWQVLNAVLKKGKVALISKGALRKGTNTEKIWRLTRFNEYLVLREIRFPDNVKAAPEAPSGKLNRDLVTMAHTVIDSVTAKWEDFDSSDSMAARMAEWMGQGTEVEAGEIVENKPEVDLMAALSQMMEDA